MSAPLTPERHPGGTRGAETTPTAATGAHSGTHEATETPAKPAPRPWTPDSHNGTIKMKRACNGCGHRLGDVTDQEMARGINGLPLPDVRRECPNCGPTAPEPRCLPTTVLLGERECLADECSHQCSTEGGIEDAYCDEVREETVCVTHSEISSSGAITRAAAWPCTHTAVTA